MRKRTIEYRVFNNRGQLLLITDNQQRASKIAIGAHGHYTKDWVDADQAQRTG